eukprot:COSAG06_NODE_54487_length_294_cov_0.820513_2_plen_30_part_01
MLESGFSMPLLMQRSRPALSLFDNDSQYAG